jgi:hypothetical protein
MTAVWASGTATITSPDAGPGTIPASGSFFNGVPFSLTPTGGPGVYHYTLTVVNGAVTATTGVFVTVVAPPVITAFSAVSDGGPGVFATGNTLTFTITYTDGGTNTNGLFTDVYLLGNVQVNSGQTIVTSIPFVAIGTPLTYTLKVTNAAGRSVVATVPIVTTP